MQRWGDGRRCLDVPRGPRLVQAAHADRGRCRRRRFLPPEVNIRRRSRVRKRKPDGRILPGCPRPSGDGTRPSAGPGGQRERKALVPNVPGGRSGVGGDEAASGTTCSLQGGVSALVVRCARPSGGEPSQPARGGEPGPAVGGEKLDRTMMMTLAFFLSNGSLPVLRKVRYRQEVVVPREATRRWNCVRRVSRSWVVQDSNDLSARGAGVPWILSSTASSRSTIEESVGTPRSGATYTLNV